MAAQLTSPEDLVLLGPEEPFAREEESVSSFSPGSISPGSISSGSIYPGPLAQESVSSFSPGSIYPGPLAQESVSSFSSAPLAEESFSSFSPVSISSYASVLVAPVLPPGEELLQTLMEAGEEKNKLFWGIIYTLVYLAAALSLIFLVTRCLSRENAQLYKGWPWLGALVFYVFLLYKYASPRRGSRLKELMAQLGDDELLTIAKNLKGFLGGKSVTPVLVELQRRGLRLE